MSLIEFIGFLISMAFLFFLFFQRKWEMYQRKKYPERYEEQRRKKDEDLKQLLSSMGLEVKNEEDEEEEDYFEEEEEEERPLPVPQRPVTPPPSPHPRTQRIVDDAYAIKTTLEQRRLMTAVEKRDLPSRLNASYKGYTGADVVSTEMRSSSDAYVIRKESTLSRGYTLMQRLSSKQEMVLYKEILDQPRSLHGWDR